MLKCPKCHIPLCSLQYEGNLVHECPDGHGTLVEEPRLERIKKNRQRRWSADDGPRFEAEAMAADSSATIRCPRCLVADMEKRRISDGDTVFHLDRCNDCGLVWLDRGELELLQIQYKKEIDSRTPEDWARIERTAVAEMRFKEAVIADTEAVEGTCNTFGNVLGSDSPGMGLLSVAVLAARISSECVQDGMGTRDPGRRVASFVSAFIFLAITIAILVLLYKIRR
jgi:Zn-finger nucleic acid-binding protein